ncbi:glycerate kinase family protein [Streptomyces clavuligerus]|uniref:Glycerate kinase n=1 Tax=Streptomyces clavuligerus TaxID=1901 RepID=B5GUW7_STRCL|nr:glycerate kinase [Streptomyces clavuligerus]ANW20565.1 glycerate kinase [Streptomyces clavuligerus]AXU15193.1 glycerate kinase [Streptomyces clavuligerus]EDY50113.1 glycerate kinase [Streptomyces clavuligerus]EFG06439.1 glycerate kinase [Streptomyces clavuligerus]MBY6305264.1 glycerate kinase [Streptomyces clavuligerus]
MLTRFAVAPSGFKESLSAQSAAEAIAEGVRRVVPEAEIDLIPLVDGGEGTAHALAAASGGRLVPLRATGPTGERIGTHFALLGADEETAVVEMAAVAGLSLVPRDLRDPGATTTYGVGELIRAALDTGVRRILVGCGDSGTSDGGAGALQALGARLLDADGRELPFGGRELTRVDRIDASGLDPRLAGTEIRVACNPFNVLCGERGVARVFGPQKGATPAQVEQLAAGLERWAAVLTRDLRVGADLYGGPGTGASGGLGAGLAALGAQLLPRFDVLLDHLDLDERLARADLVVTAEGALDHQTPRGKVPAEVARRAKRYDRPVLALAGTIGEGAQQVRSAGVDAYSSILPAPVSLTEALGRGGEFLADATERALRMILIGTRLPAPQPVVSGTQRPSSVR